MSNCYNYSSQLIAARRERRPRTVGNLPMQSVRDDGAYEAEDVSDHGCNHDEHNRAIGSNGLTKYTGLIMCARKTKSRIDCAQPMRTITEQIICQPPINAAITSRTVVGSSHHLTMSF